MVDLTAFGLEPQEASAGDESDDVNRDAAEVWSACVDCEYAGYDVKERTRYTVPLCPTCFADREGLQ
ncbi:hypothetical protein [Natrarchaeobaculum sulfurireducens]|uniref:Uncharacterized protein n=1 Tax=Natrarchaeobaculum sulfurireducens TaxID=2044521 RepID=A0A346PG36_9EURY|nr:hypothetical protein [Natrarchaeobaculum sulfurireducens]AXR78481.1 hypothetical protein AArc1_2165 [Natrarchaeobaculum sulfurireducens]